MVKQNNATGGMQMQRTLIMLLATFGPWYALGQELPELASPLSASGNPTTARFFGGASADNGETFGSSFDFNTPLDISGSIQIEESHINTVGNLYIVVLLGEDYLYRDSEGNYQAWNLELSTLQAASPDKTLSSFEPLTIVDDVPLGPAGAAGLTLSIFFAYNTSAVPGELYYSGTPVTLAIGTEAPAEPASLTLYNASISAPIVQSRCVSCHVGGGASGNTRLVFVRSSVDNYMTLNYNEMVDFVRNTPNGASLILSKPQGIGHGGGIQLPSGSIELNNLSKFVEAL
ncbi:MAG: hypothetical protein VXZ91_07760 [Pseudomonadota bacterium]|nr:hypothetical protein [Pseudomonadota bacterium]